MSGDGRSARPLGRPARGLAALGRRRLSRRFARHRPTSARFRRVFCFYRVLKTRAGVERPLARCRPFAVIEAEEWERLQAALVSAPIDGGRDSPTSMAVRHTVPREAATRRVSWPASPESCGRGRRCPAGRRALTHLAVRPCARPRRPLVGPCATALRRLGARGFAPRQKRWRCARSTSEDIYQSTDLVTRRSFKPCRRKLTDWQPDDSSLVLAGAMNETISRMPSRPLSEVSCWGRARTSRRATTASSSAPVSGLKRSEEC